MRRIAPPLLTMAFVMLTACSEARSDIENLEPAMLEEEAKALSESAQDATREQVQQIQPMAIDGVTREAAKSANDK